MHTDKFHIRKENKETDMYQVIKRDGKVVDFDLKKIAVAIRKAFEAQNTEYTDDIIDFLALKTTADYAAKVKDGKIGVEDIQDSVETVLEKAGYEVEDFGITPAPIEEIVGGTPEENAQVTRDILDGKHGPKTDIVCLNAAAGFFAAGKVDNLADGFALAKETIASGAAKEKLAQFVELSNK